MANPARKTAQVARDRALEHHVSRLMIMVPPWIGVALLVPAAAVLHRSWPYWWAAAAVIAAATFLGWVAVKNTHDRGAEHRIHLAATCALAAGWLAAADLAGFTKGIWFAWVLCGWTAALSWNIKAGARHAGLGNMLGHLLTAAHESAGLEGARASAAPAAGGIIKGRVHGVPGAHTGKNFVDDARRVESGAGLPPGSIAYTPDPRLASAAVFTVSDPRGITDPVPWPGPSAVGGSVAAPLRPGVWQTREPVQMRLVPVHHILIAGMTGAAKSTGWGWSILAEAITRTDVRIYGLDVVKGDQTLGPFRSCLATDAPGCETGLLTEPADAGAFMAHMRSRIRPRTDYLDSAGLQEWREGCGIPLDVVWMEEGPDVVDALGSDEAEEWVKSMKAARTAGIMFVYSCQRPDWSQMPTIARAQFGGRVAGGVSTSGDADLCVSERQSRANVEPDQWADRMPGMAYLDGRWVPDEKIAVAARAYYWGGDNALIRQHAAAFPAREVEDKMRRPKIFARPRSVPEPPDEDWPPGREDEPLGRLTERALGEPDPDPQDGEDVGDHAEDGDWEFATDPDPVEQPELDARQLFDAWLAERAQAGQRVFRAGDLVELRAQCGRSRSWVYDELGRRVALGQLTRQGDDGTWTVVRAA